MHQNLRNTEKEILIGKSVVINAYIKKKEKSKIKNLILHFKDLEKEHSKPIVDRRKEII